MVYFMILDKKWLIILTVTHEKTFWPRSNRKVTTVQCSKRISSISSELMMSKLQTWWDWIFLVNFLAQHWTKPSFGFKHAHQKAWGFKDKQCQCYSLWDINKESQHQPWCFWWRSTWESKVRVLRWYLVDRNSRLWNAHKKGFQPTQWLQTPKI